MVNLYPQLIKIPAFMTKFIEINKLNTFKKFYLIIKGKLTIIVLGSRSKKIICFYLNNFFRFEGNIKHDGEFYFKEVHLEKIYYPNERITRILINQNEFLEHIYDSYLLDKINFNKSDFVVDCGANVGEVYLAFKNKGIPIDYCGIEPDKNAYICLNRNTLTDNLNICLSEVSGKVDFFVDGLGANSSIHKSSTTLEKIEIYSDTLDNVFSNKKIKLLKIDAEGHELEVLKGGSEVLKNIEYISVDCGPEKGITQNITFVEVNNFLLKHGFKLKDINKDRLIVLYEYNG